MKFIVILIVFLSMYTQSSLAQVVFEGCGDINGIQVPSIQSTAINDIAVATIQNGWPVIIYNPDVANRFPRDVRAFFFAHECGHHALGHVLYGMINIAAEQEADCFAIRNLVERGLFNEHNIYSVQVALSNFARGDWSHLPGLRRAINLRACLQDTDSSSHLD